MLKESGVPIFIACRQEVDGLTENDAKAAVINGMAVNAEGKALPQPTQSSFCHICHQTDTLPSYLGGRVRYADHFCIGMPARVTPISPNPF